MTTQIRPCIALLVAAISCIIISSTAAAAKEGINRQTNRHILCPYSSPPLLYHCSTTSISKKHQPCHRYITSIPFANRALLSQQLYQCRPVHHQSNVKLYQSTSTTQSTSSSSISISNNNNNSNEYPLIILIGGSGFLGSEIRAQLKQRNLHYIATSTSGKSRDEDEEKFVKLDWESRNNAEEQVYQLITSQLKAGDTSGEGSNRKVAIISAMGSIGTNQDELVNSALSNAIKGAHRVNNLSSSLSSSQEEQQDEDEQKEDEKIVERFIMIGNTDRVRRLASNVPFLKGYASGKEDSESVLRECFGDKGCIIKPTFIYGGEEISLNPPRIPSSLGGLASEVLGLYPFQALADNLPDALAVPLAPPINVEMVAAASINVALGLVDYPTELEGEAITMAGSVRGWKEKLNYENWIKDELAKEGIDIYSSTTKDTCSMEDLFDENINDDRRYEKIESLKVQLLAGISDTEEEISVMEELECLKPESMRPAYDSKLNGQWNFVLSKNDLGTQLIKELLPPEYYSFGDDDTDKSSSPLRSILSSLYSLKGLYMRIHSEQTQVEIVLSSKIIFGQVPIDVVFGTSLEVSSTEPDGTLFLEKFESIEVGGVSLPIPESWQRYRYLEITYLDDDIVIARGSGGDPHVLVRARGSRERRG